MKPDLTRKDFLTALGAGAGMLAATGLKGNPSTFAPATGASAGLAVVPPASPPSPMSDLICLDDFEARARQVLPAPVFDFVNSGAADELTLKWNREKYREIRLQERVLIDVSGVDCSTQILGQKMSMPILLAPTSNHRSVHPDGELATARGAGKAGATMVLSSGANTSIEDVMRVATHPVWFQLYVAADRGIARALIQRVEAAGAKALCVTVDAPIDGARNHQDRHRMIMPPGVGYPHYVGITEPPTIQTIDRVRPSRLEWRDIEWIRSLTRMPIFLKGIMNPLDADHGIRLGVDGIMVSNHGGRNLDTQPATIEALPRVAEKVAGRVPIIVDGGIRRGTDVVKALALGASAVQIGRPYLFGLAAGGEDGVARVVKLLREELLLAMSLLGRPNLAAIDRTVLWPERERS